MPCKCPGTSDNVFRHTTLEYDVVTQHLEPGTTPVTLAELKAELLLLERGP